MLAAKIVEEDWDVSVRLRELFDIDKGEIVPVILAAVQGRRDSVDDDPITAGGQFSYIYGTRALRALFCSKGWKKNRKGGVESVVDRRRGLKVIFQNADWAADKLRDPKAISTKGNQSQLAVRLGQGDLFAAPDLDGAVTGKENVWYLFVSVDGDDIRAEISRPRAIEGGQFLGFHERVFIIAKGELTSLRLRIDDDEPQQEYDVKITKK